MKKCPFTVFFRRRSQNTAVSSWIWKKIDRNYSRNFTQQKTETGVWKTLPALKGINIWQAFIDGNKKAANLKNWRMVKGNNCGNTLSDTAGEFWRELKEPRVHNFLTSTHPSSLPQNASQDRRELLHVSLARMQGGQQNHITPKSCSRVKPEVLKSLEEPHSQAWFFPKQPETFISA